MTIRSHPRRAVVLWLAASLAAHPAASASSVVEMEPGRAAQEALAPLVPGPPRSVALDIAFPREGAIYSDEPFAHLSGRLEAPFGVLGRVDAVAVIDTSESTARSAPDGRSEDPVMRRVRGRSPRQPPPSILQQEIRSALVLLDDVDPRSTRLGIVSFAGAPEGQTPDPTTSARTEVPVTPRLDRLDEGLQRLARRGARGRTDMAAGLDRAVAELTGRGLSRPDPAAAKVVVFFTDGMPTLPHRHTGDNERAVFEAAERAAAAGVRVFSFAIGPEALRRPTAAVEIAQRTGGVYTAVRDPRDLTAAVKETVQLASSGRLTVRNASLRANALDLHVGEDGVFGGLVPLRPGKNRIFVRAVTGNVTAEAERSVHYAPGTAVTFVPEARELPRLPTLASRKDVEIVAGDPQGRSLELSLDPQHKELSIQVGDAPPPAALAPGPGR